MGKEAEARYPSWQKERTFVRAITGKYSELYRELHNQPRIFKSKDVSYTGGPVHFAKAIVSPRIPSVLMTQAIESAIETIAPGGHSAKHGHMNGAIMYILEGKGYEIHDKERRDWQAGDVFVVRNGCVHQHFNRDSERPAKILVLKSKPLFMFFHMLFQKTIEEPPDEPLKGWEGWQPAD